MIGVVGISHNSAPVSIREKIAFDGAESACLSRAILDNRYFREVMVISTCNRTEIYFTSEGICTHGALKNIQALVVKSKGIEENITPYLFNHFHDGAVKHLFRVIAGLDSMVLGEYQIVSQVKSAFNDAAHNNCTGKILHRLITAGLNCSKQVRASTKLNIGALSVSYAAVEKCREQFTNLTERSILLIGAGDTGKLVLKNLVKKGCQNIIVTNRTYELAKELAECYKVESLPFENLHEGIHKAEIIISSISCRDHLLDAKGIKPHLNGHESLLIIDLGVPRNINPDVTTIPGTTLLNVDDLNGVINNNIARKQEYLTIAEQIIGEHVKIFTGWLCGQNLSPVIKKIEKRLKLLFAAEFNNFREKFPEQEHDELEKFNLHMADKIKKKIVKQLYSVTDNGRNTEFVGAINQLFEDEKQ